MVRKSVSFVTQYQYQSNAISICLSSQPASEFVLICTNSSDGTNFRSHDHVIIIINSCTLASSVCCQSQTNYLRQLSWSTSGVGFQLQLLLLLLLLKTVLLRSLIQCECGHECVRECIYKCCPERQSRYREPGHRPRSEYQLQTCESCGR